MVSSSFSPGCYKRENCNFTVEKPGHHLNWVTKVNTTSNEKNCQQLALMWLQHKDPMFPKCTTWISLWGNTKQIKLRGVLQNNWPAPSKSICNMNIKERLSNCSLFKGTKEAWQLNAVRILDWIPDQEKAFFPPFLIKDTSPATARMNLEDIMLNEIIQPKNDKSCVIPLLWSIYLEESDS